MNNVNCSFLYKVFITPLCLWSLIGGVFILIRIGFRLSGKPDMKILVTCIIAELFLLLIFLKGYKSTNDLFQNGVKVNAKFEVIRNSVFDQMLVIVHYEVNGHQYSKKMSISEVDVRGGQSLELIVSSSNPEKFRILMPKKG